jgi:hypothetical protein
MMVKGVAQFDYLIQKGNELKDILDKAKNNPDKITDAENIVDELLPMAYAEIERVSGDGNTFYTLRCSECSLLCELKIRFSPPETITYCLLQGGSGALFEVVNTEIVTE